jgi:alpha-ribazole phosphatase
VTHVLLIRHGETEWNATKRIQGHSNTPLNDLGRKQARALAGRLKNKAIAAIYSSDLDRAKETIAPTAAALGMEIQTDVRLREKSFGDWEGLSLDEVAEKYPELWQMYHTDHDLKTPIPNGETWEQVQARVLDCLKDILAKHSLDETVIVVSHGGSVRPIIMYALNAPLTSIIRVSVDNAGITHLEFRTSSTGRVHTLNDTAHLEGLI